MDETERDAIWEEVERRLDAENHDDLCGCVRFPDGCVTYGNQKLWSFGADRAVTVALDIVAERDRVVAANAWDEAIAAAQSLGDAIGHYQVTLKSPINPYRITKENN